MASPATGEAQVLSDVRDFSRWAYVIQPGTVYERPDARSDEIGQLDTRTQDDTPELVLALSQVNTDDGEWVEVRFTARPNTDAGWIRRSNLGAFHENTTFLKIVRGRYRAFLYRGGRRIWSAPVGVGRPQWPTPSGQFYIRERLIPPQGNTIYGSFAVGTSATSPTLTDWPGGSVVGMHGTNEPELIPGKISHGCIRVRNREIDKLRRLLPLGTPVLIQ